LKTRRRIELKKGAGRAETEDRVENLKKGENYIVRKGTIP